MAAAVVSASQRISPSTYLSLNIYMDMYRHSSLSLRRRSLWTAKRRKRAFFLCPRSGGCDAACRSDRTSRETQKLHGRRAEVGGGASERQRRTDGRLPLLPSSSASLRFSAKSASRLSSSDVSAPQTGLAADHVQWLLERKVDVLKAEKEALEEKLQELEAKASQARLADSLADSPSNSLANSPANWRRKALSAEYFQSNAKLQLRPASCANLRRQRH